MDDAQWTRLIQTFDTKKGIINIMGSLTTTGSDCTDALIQYPSVHVHMRHSTVTVKHVSSSEALPWPSQPISTNRMLRSVAMDTVPPREPVVTFSRSRLMIRRPELNAHLWFTSQEGKCGSQRGFTLKTHCDNRHQSLYGHTAADETRQTDNRSVTESDSSLRNVILNVILYTKCDACHQ